MEKELPLVITKAWLAQRFERPFRWIREHLLTDEVLTQDLDYKLSEFKQWRSFPPIEGNRLKKWLKQQELI